MVKKTNNSKDKTILVISDIQAPFHHRDTLEFLAWAKNQYSPDVVVNIGDLSDSYCLTAWQRDPQAISATEEIERMLEFIKEYNKIFPKGHILTSNHDMRLHRAAIRANIPKHYLKNYHDWMGLSEGWTFHNELIIDDIIFTHGEEGGAGGQAGTLNRVKHYGMSCVSGHYHTKAEIQYLATRDKLMFGMQVGCLIDRHQLAFAYCRTSLKKPVLSIGVIVNGIPQIVPMLLDDNGRWINRKKKRVAKKMKKQVKSKKVSKKSKK